jgi:RNA polymerase sigma factor FliA
VAWREQDGWEPYKPPGRPAAPAAQAKGSPSLAPVNGAAPEDEDSLWRRWRGEADLAARAMLVERYMPYARALAAKLYGRRRHDEIALDEYVQFAMVGLMECVERYTPDRGAKFTTYAIRRIHGAILNGLERLTEKQQQIAFRRRVTAERLASFVPEDFSTDPTQRLLGELEEIGVGVALGLILEGTGLVLGPREGLPEDAYAHAQIELRQLHAQLWGMLDRLPDREREILEMHYRRSRRFDEIAGMMQLSKGRVSQLHRQAIMRLRSLLSGSDGCDVAY